MYLLVDRYACTSKGFFSKYDINFSSFNLLFIARDKIL